MQSIKEFTKLALAAIAGASVPVALIAIVVLALHDKFCRSQPEKLPVIWAPRGW